jgi:hypothetical protein
MLLGTDLVGWMELGMEIEEVDDHALDGIPKRIVAKAMSCLGKSAFHGFKIHTANLLLLGLQPHDGVLEQKELPSHTVVALGRAELDELLCHVNDIHTEIRALLQVHYQVTPAGNNQTVAGLEAESPSVAFEGTMPSVAIGMAQIVGKRGIADSLQRAVNDDMLYKIAHLLANYSLNRPQS